MKRVFLILLLSITVLFASIDLNTATKEQLIAIKGIGSVKAEQIIEYRKSHKIKSADDLNALKGFGPALISNIKKDKKSK